MVWEYYIFISDRRDFLNVGVRNPQVTTDHHMVLSCLWGSEACHKNIYQCRHTTWKIAPLAGGEGVMRRGHQVPIPPVGGQDSQERRKEACVLDIQGHIALGGPTDRTTPSPIRGSTQSPQSDLTRSCVAPGGPRPQGK